MEKRKFYHRRNFILCKCKIYDGATNLINILIKGDDLLKKYSDI